MANVTKKEKKCIITLFNELCPQRFFSKDGKWFENIWVKV